MLQGTGDITPYAATALSYFDCGWSPIPLPPRSKVPPPTGFTGWQGEYATRTDLSTWLATGTYETRAVKVRTHQAGNIGLRMHDGIIGVDVDDYAKTAADGRVIAKRGAAELARLAAEAGEPLPPSWRLTSRPSTPSGISFYRVPMGMNWRDDLDDIEIIHRGHRYAVAAPSIHPEGRAYVWQDPAGNLCDTIPEPSQMPELPAPWVALLSKDSGRADKTDLSDAEAQSVLDALPAGAACHHVAGALAEATVALADGAKKHTTTRDAAARIVRYGRDGCPGAQGALKALRVAFLAAVDPAEREDRKAAWERQIAGAAGIVAADPQGLACPDDFSAWVPGTGSTPQSTAASPDLEDQGEQAAEDTIPAPSPFDKAVSRAVAEMRVREHAREVLAAERATAAYHPPPVLGLAELIASTQAEALQWRWEGLAEIGDRVLIEAKAKTGKTTLLGNVAESLLSGRALLDHFPTTAIPPEAVLVYIDTELGPRRLARWLAEAIPDQHRDRVAVWSVAGRAGSLDIRQDRLRARMAAQVTEALAGRTAGFLIVDVASAWTAPLGIDENDNAAVRAYLESLHTFALDIGADGMALAHHTGHSAERSRGASAWRDWPDVFATLTRSEDADDTARYLSALGRGVDVPESQLHFDPQTRHLSVSGAVGLSRRSAARERVATGYLDTVTEVVTLTPGLGTRELRDAVTQALKDQGDTVKAAAVGESITRASSAGLIHNASTGRRADWQPGPAEDTETERGHIGGHIPESAQDVSLGVPDVSPTAGDNVSTCPRAYVVGAYTQDTPDTSAEEDTHTRAAQTLTLAFNVPADHITEETVA